MSRSIPRIALTRAQILSCRRRFNHLEQRLPAGANSLRLAAWAGLQDSMPRAALFSIHARVRGTTAETSEHASLVQLWGPRFSDYVVASKDLPVFSLGRLPEDHKRRQRAITTASRLHEFLNGRRMPFGQAGREMGVSPNSLRYAAAAGTVLLRWDGARQPVVWTTADPSETGLDARDARVELARRYLHIFGPALPASFARWAGIGRPEAAAVFDTLASAGSLTPVRTPVGDSWILAADEAAFRAAPAGGDSDICARLLPSGDSYFLLWGADREILLPAARHRAELWTTRVWPGALLLAGEIVGAWRRTAGELSITAWRKLTAAQWEMVEAEVKSLPMPGNPPVMTIVRN